jgi:hypothetical protein
MWTQRKDFTVRIALTDAVRPPAAFGSDFAPGQPRAAKTTVAASAQQRNDEAPDPTFWTAYDYFMLEREARAVRRAFVFSQLVGWMRKLRGSTAA